MALPKSPRPLFASVALGIALYVLGLGLLDYRVPDAAFGLAYWLSCKLGLWYGGPSWVEQDRLLALICFLIWPLALCVGYAYVLISMPCYLWGRRGVFNRAQAIVLAVVLAVLPLLAGRQTESVELSFRGHADANY
jgi:hypothetical protein